MKIPILFIVYFFVLNITYAQSITVVEQTKRVCFDETGDFNSIKFEKDSLASSKGFLGIELTLNHDLEFKSYKKKFINFYYYNGVKCAKRIKKQESIQNYVINESELVSRLKKIKFYNCGLDSVSVPADSIHKLILNIPIHN